MRSEVQRQQAELAEEIAENEAVAVRYKQDIEANEKARKEIQVSAVCGRWGRGGRHWQPDLAGPQQAGQVAAPETPPFPPSPTLRRRPLRRLWTAPTMPTCPRS